MKLAQPSRHEKAAPETAFSSRGSSDEQETTCPECRICDHSSSTPNCVALLPLLPLPLSKGMAASYDRAPPLSNQLQVLRRTKAFFAMTLTAIILTASYHPFSLFFILVLRTTP